MPQPNSTEQLEHLWQGGGVHHGGRGRVHHCAQVHGELALLWGDVDLGDIWIPGICFPVKKFNDILTNNFKIGIDYSKFE